MIYILLIIIVFLIIIIVSQNIKIHKISNSINMVTKGNLNERIRLADNSTFLKSLIVNINRLIDEFQGIVMLNKEYENDRKKMISNISHDLRTPLTSIIGYIEMLKSDNSLSDSERINYLNIISSKGEFLRNLLDDFFNLSKLDSDDIQINPKSLNITELIRQCILSFFKDFEAKGITPVVELPDKDVFTEADEKAVYRILQNLISNSLKYGIDGKVIGITLEESEDKIAIEVWDKGIGIPEEDIPYIFKRLYTVDKSRNGRLKGSGLGLSIVKKLVEKHNGIIRVSSKSLEKTAFRVTLYKKLRNM